MFRDDDGFPIPSSLCPSFVLFFSFPSPPNEIGFEAAYEGVHLQFCFTLRLVRMMLEVTIHLSINAVQL